MAGEIRSTQELLDNLAAVTECYNIAKGTLKATESLGNPRLIDALRNMMDVAQSEAESIREQLAKNAPPPKRLP